MSLGHVTPGGRLTAELSESQDDHEAGEESGGHQPAILPLLVRLAQQLLRHKPQEGGNAKGEDGDEDVEIVRLEVRQQLVSSDGHPHDDEGQPKGHAERRTEGHFFLFHFEHGRHSKEEDLAPERQRHDDAR